MIDERTTWEHQWATTPSKERAAVWRAHRIAAILSSNSPRPLTDAPTVVLHVFPSTAFNGNATLPKLQRELFAGAASLASNHGRIKSNIDGVIVFGENEPTYAQVFRDEVIEYVSSHLLTTQKEKEIDIESLANFLGQFLLTIPKCLAWQEEDRTYGLTLLRVKEHRFLGARSHLSFDRDVIVLPLLTTKEPLAAVKQLQQLLIEAHGQG